MDQTTIYSNVEFRGNPGKLRLTAGKIAFKPDDWSDGKYDSWRWTAVKKHQVTSKNAERALLKLVSQDDSSKAVVFKFPTHQQLEKARNDITDRMRPIRDGSSTNNQRRSSIDTIGHGEFLAKQNRRDSTLSFNNSYSFSDLNIDASMSSDSLHMNPDGTHMDRSTSTMDNSKAVKAKRPSGLLLDPVSGTGKTKTSVATASKTASSQTKATSKKKKPTSRSVQSTKAVSGTKTNKKVTSQAKRGPEKKSTKRSGQAKTETNHQSMKKKSSSGQSSSRLLTLVTLCMTVVAVLFAAGSLGCFNGKIEKLQIERMFPSIIVNPAKECKKGIFQKCATITPEAKWSWVSSWPTVAATK